MLVLHWLLAAGHDISMDIESGRCGEYRTMIVEGIEVGRIEVDRTEAGRHPGSILEPTLCSAYE